MEKREREKRSGKIDALFKLNLNTKGWINLGLNE